MGFSGISLTQLLVILAIVLLIFGGKRLRNLGGDLGSSIKGFKSAMKDGAEGKDGNNGKDKDDDRNLENNDGNVIDVESEKREQSKHS